MAITPLTLKVAPLRMLTTRQAADYCGLPIKRFSYVCRVKPIQFPGSSFRYDMRDLDEWLDGLKAGLPNGDDEIIARLGE